MKETGNVFDASTTLMEIEDLPEGEADLRPDDKQTPEVDDEPDYFSPPAAAKGGEARRRATGVLGVVGGMVCTVALVSVATGLGQDQPSEPPPSAVQPERSAPSAADKQTAPVVEVVRARRQRSMAAVMAQEQARDERLRAKAKAKAEAEAKVKAARSRDRRDDDAPVKAAAPAPEPEPTYTPEPEPTYVPAETAPPPSPEPAPAPAAEPRQEFGIEP
jgi:hypothetical protein